MNEGGRAMWDNVLLALQSLSTNKMRAVLTMLGIIIGIGAVIAIETVGGSLSGTITDSMSSFGASDITVSVVQKEEDDSNPFGITLRLFQSATPDEKSRITETMIDEYCEAFSDKVEAIKLTESVGTGIVSADDVTVSVSGWNDDAQSAEDLELLYGRFINNERDGERKVCLVADKFVEDAMDVPAIKAIGEAIRVTVNRKPQVFYIVGVYKYEEGADLMTALFSNGATNLYLPLECARSLSKADDGYTSFTVVTAPGTDTSSFMSLTEDFFASYYTRNDSWTAEASSIETLVSTLTDMLDKVSIAIAAIAAISLLVGGIGVMNIMLVSVTERTKEIGTRKALGAPGSAIRMQFIVEAVVICLIGGMLGILVGIGLGAIACDILGYPAKADYKTIALVVGISVSIGVFFGYYPANKASKLDPIEALRYE